MRSSTVTEAEEPAAARARAALQAAIRPAAPPPITNKSEYIKKRGKLSTSHRYDLLPLLHSCPGGVQRELVVYDFPHRKDKNNFLFRFNRSDRQTVATLN